ncbi:uncharacterized protein MELLADRAFT_123585 [Melampsora larici-populina 98AG31]|uniref:Secreted protein n=1 Tax=Melampsora larici-populina (strain 98AG31 / pathotype 3-4-7) TaxID=747676 RepID=F4R5E8_MELLP|nr:uncharacterized protein MELLADRAFT_123585 [Melampsora larici-populina 98AG31]EGG12031.1 secreted protein [Melampsora larici-populina 98AG31]
MLKIFLKISLLLFSIWIHNSNVLAEKTFSAACRRQFTIVNGKGVCVQASPDDHQYSCVVDSCHERVGDLSYNYVEMTACTHDGSVNKGQSKQNCAQYQFMHNNNGGYFTCTNPAGYHYTCERNQHNIYRQLTCSKCTK